MIYEPKHGKRYALENLFDYYHQDDIPTYTRDTIFALWFVAVGLVILTLGGILVVTGFLL